MSEMRDAVAASGLAVVRVRESILSMGGAARALAGPQLVALVAALESISQVQGAVMIEIERMQGAEHGK